MAVGRKSGRHEFMGFESAFPKTQLKNLGGNVLKSFFRKLGSKSLTTIQQQTNFTITKRPRIQMYFMKSFSPMKSFLRIGFCRGWEICRRIISKIRHSRCLESGLSPPTFAVCCPPLGQPVPCWLQLEFLCHRVLQYIFPVCRWRGL